MTEENQEGTEALGIQMPEDLSALTPQELEKLGKKATDAFNKINGQEKVTAKDVEIMAALADQIDALSGESTTRAEAEAALQAKREELAGRVTPKAEEGDPEAAPTDPPADPPADPADPPAPGDPEEEKTPEGELVGAGLAASVNKGAGAKPGRRAPVSVSSERTDPTKASWDTNGMSITASSDIPGVPSGSTLDKDGLVSAIKKRVRPMSDGQSALVASLSLKDPKWDASNINTDESLLEFWDKRHTPPEEGLVASGGWCSPSEIIYDFVCDYETVDSLVDLPTVTTSRGGIRFPESPVLGGPTGAFINAGAGYPVSAPAGVDAAFAQIGFTWTEADDIAAATPGGPQKPCFQVECPTFDEQRLQAEGICLTAGNLTDRAYPELTARYLDMLLTAHAHRINGITLAKMEAGATATTAATVDADLGAVESAMGLTELYLAAFRDVYFAGEDAELEFVLPRWTRGVFRRDIFRRNAENNKEAMAQNAAIAKMFGDIGARVQFVGDWHSMTATHNDVTAFTSWPATARGMMFVPGTFSKMSGGNLDLGVTRDSTLNATNDFTAAWTEEFWGVVKRGCFAIKFDIPLCPNGTTGIQAAYGCPTV